MLSAATTAYDPLTRLIIAGFAVGVIIHNLEEAAFLVPWIIRHVPRLWVEPNRRIYTVLTSAVSVVISATAVGVIVWPGNRQLLYALSGFAIAMSINAVFPHMAACFLTRSYSPGTASGILLNLPFGLWLVYREMSRCRLTWSDIWRHSLDYTLGLGLFAFGGLYLAHALRRSTLGPLERRRHSRWLGQSNEL